MFVLIFLLLSVVYGEKCLISLHFKIAGIDTNGEYAFGRVFNDNLQCVTMGSYGIATDCNNIVKISDNGCSNLKSSSFGVDVQLSSSKVVANLVQTNYGSHMVQQLNKTCTICLQVGPTSKCNQGMVGGSEIVQSYTCSKVGDDNYWYTDCQNFLIGHNKMDKCLDFDHNNNIKKIGTCYYSSSSKGTSSTFASLNSCNLDSNDAPSNLKMAIYVVIFLVPFFFII